MPTALPKILCEFVRAAVLLITENLAFSERIKVNLCVEQHFNMLDRYF